MYCMRCGVELEKGTAACPLCGTPVWDPKPQKKNPHYNPGLYPEKENSGKYWVLGVLTCILAGVIIGCTTACLVYYGRLAWSAYVLAGILFFYLTAVLPLWFVRYYPLIFLPVSFAALEGLTLFICLYTGGSWFLPFAFPVTGLLFLFAFLGYGLAVIKIKPRIKLRLSGVYFFLLGGATMLVEFFLHLAFRLPMFNWSIYTAALFGLFGIFLFVASFILPLRRTMYKKMFY
ncbi:MAG: zinc ribbon domain-containing protein [Lachnospiraceae bacterium]|nr:zinc ribbon domain-containing protein [Lachnospiraceae bacterium]